MRRTARSAAGGIALAAATVLLLGVDRPAVAYADRLSEATSAIEAYAEQPAHAELLGEATAKVRAVQGGAARSFTGGEVYYSPSTGAHSVLGAVAARYRAVGGPATIGFPVDDEQAAGDGRYSEFSAPDGARIYWSPRTRASLLTGGVLRAWLASDGVSGPFGFPVTDTTFTGMDDESTFAGPEGTEISWSSTRGLTTVPAGLAAAHPAMAQAADAAAAPSETTGSRAAATDAEGVGWWPWLAGLGLLALFGLVVALLPRRRRPARAVATTVAPAVPAPVTRAPVTPAPVTPTPVTGPPATREVPAVDVPAETGEPAVYDPLSEETLAASSAVLSYESPETAGIVVEYENNAVGTERDSRADAHARAIA